MEALQLAQMLADLNDLQAAQDQTAATALVNANKNLDRSVKDGAVSSPGAAATAAPTSHARASPALHAFHAVDRSRLASPAGRFDKLGRRIFSPPLSRTNSFTPSSSIPGTPRHESDEPDDVDRASVLMSLYDLRAKHKEQDNSSLQRARDKINAIAAKQAQQAQQQHAHQPSAHRAKDSK